MSENSQNRASWPVAFGNAPRKGSRSMFQNLDFTVESPVGINLVFEQQSGKLEFIQGMFIDNSANPAALTCTMRTTGQSIIIPPDSQAYIPVLATMDNAKMSFATTGTPIIPVQFLNFPVAPIIWSTAGGTAVSISGTVSSGANTNSGTSSYAALGGTGNALLINTPVAVKTTAGNLYGINFVNKGATDAYVQFFDAAAGAVTPGTTIPKLAFWVPAGGAWEEKFTDECKITFANAITCCATTTSTGGTSAAGGILGNILFK